MPQSERPVVRVEEGAQRGRNPVDYRARVVPASSSCRRQAALKVFRRLCLWVAGFRLGSPRVVIRGEYYPFPLPLPSTPAPSRSALDHSMVGPYGQPLGLGPLGRVFRAGAFLLKRGGRSLQLLRRYAPTSIFCVNAILKVCC